jgi:uncharacterized protein (DUF427 family)
MEKQLEVTGRGLNIVEAKYSDNAAISEKGCPIANYVIRRKTVEENILVITKNTGHKCPIKWAAMWYYCAVTGESKKIVFTSGATEEITSGGATSDFWSPHK